MLSNSFTQEFQCSQCGSPHYEALENNLYQCNFCQTIYRKNQEEEQDSEDAGLIFETPRLIISKDANVVFGKNSKVVIKGSVEIEKGANVKVLGELTVVKIGDTEKIKEGKNKFGLEKL